MRWSDLFRDPGNGRLSHTRLWANLGNLVLAIVVARDGWVNGLDHWQILAFGTVVCGSAAASKWLSLRYKNGNGDGPKQ